jgi:polyribonucleotide nucleotidyltransferase
VLQVGGKVMVEISEVDDRGKLSLVPVLEDEESQSGQGEPSGAPAS